MAKKQESVAEAELKKAPGKKYVKKFDTEEADEMFEAAEPEPKKRGRPAKVNRDTLQKFSTDGDLVDVWERRILNPNHQESTAIRIKTPGMRLRWINLTNRGRFQRARYEQGWVPVHKNELTDEREIWGVTYTAEGYVCRGEKQGEMLMKIPQAVYKQIQKRRAELNQQSYKKLRDNISGAGYQHFKDRDGGDAADVAVEAASKFVGNVKFGTEKASSDELF